LKAALCFDGSIEGGDEAGRAQAAPEIGGETLNLSETGLAISVPSNQIGDRYLNVVGRTLRLTLELPAGTVRMRATPKWSQWSEEDLTARSFLVGLRITEMSDEEWVLLVRYVHACL
jgi:hypothetical protein